MSRQLIHGRELFPLPTPSPRERALRVIKRELMRLSTTGARDDFKLVERIFAAARELREV